MSDFVEGSEHLDESNSLKISVTAFGPEVDEQAGSQDRQLGRRPLIVNANRLPTDEGSQRIVPGMEMRIATAYFRMPKSGIYWSA